MTLGELIAALKAAPQDRVVRRGFDSPHSYRGYYDQLAFEPAENVRVSAMLDAARSALGRVFTGYKGGEYRMHGHTECHLANYGDCGEELGASLLAYMLADAVESPTPSAPVREAGEDVEWRRGRGETVESVHLFRRDGEVLCIVAGKPEEHGTSHHCDAMGCGYAHVLYRTAIATPAPVVTDDAARLEWLEKRAGESPVGVWEALGLNPNHATLSEAIDAARGVQS